MDILLTAVPMLPLTSAVLLLLFGRNMPQRLVTGLGVGSVGLAALSVLALALQWQDSAGPMTVLLWQWLSVGSFSVDLSLRLDQLSLIWLCTITGIGFLIHLYSSEYMSGDRDYSRYFAYLNLFVAAMLLLVLGDNLLLLYLGWEGVGLCSYLLIGFWYQDSANGAAARKAFIVTRAGDAAMALGLFLLVAEFNTLNIQAVIAAASRSWAAGETLPTLACVLILAGAVGKSAQLPLQTWLPDAMAGPTPVSALIHAATMVTAGIYLVARLSGLFLLAPDVLFAVAVVGVATALVAACAALAQTDIKRILAYSTISQLGYMFLALGVQAWDAGVFHMMTHAFFKALLFLSAGAVIECLHHEQDIRKMGGLRKALPVPFWSVLIGSAALAALPATAGFASKDLILLRAWEADGGVWLWFVAAIAALITALYSFKLVFVVFFGNLQTEPTHQPGWRMALPLTLLCALSIVGGWISLPLAEVLPLPSGDPAHGTIAIVSAAIPIVGVALAYVIFQSGKLDASRVTQSTAGRRTAEYWLEGWGMDRFYAWLLVRPYARLAQWWRGEPMDHVVALLTGSAVVIHEQLSVSQSGRMGRYVAVLSAGLILMLTLMLIRTAT
ncbi:MAG: NADH-quinone oxidoreductase subunit L [Luminiphilus sp.]|nr:NADH-quinone oxidoreductase subunit L [Luminiphilus sp.]